MYLLCERKSVAMVAGGGGLWVGRRAGGCGAC